MSHFDGSTYDPHYDQQRLSTQLERVRTLMFDRQWRTLDEISGKTGDPPSSVSARLRDLRKSKFGSHTVERQPHGDRHAGLFEYRVVINKKEN
jgi:hypothetical protein